jgi:RNAse (barnase) inhibitor barstar
MPTVIIPTKRITDWASFHAVFAEIMGFPDFYGRNMNAWIDCMTSLDSPDDGMSKVHSSPHDMIVLHLADVDDFRSRCRELYDAIVEGSAFVNFRKLDMGEPAVLALSFWKDEPNLQKNLAQDT